MSGHEYFSERMASPVPLDQSDLGLNFWKGFVGLIWRLDEGSYFAEDFPYHCTDSPIPVGTASRILGLALTGDIPEVGWPFDPENLPSNQFHIFDALEFFYQHVSKPTSFSHHSFFKHNHIISFDREVGKEEYRAQVNQLFRRNRHPYELKDHGRVERTGLPALVSILQTRFHTGDSHLDGLLETARAKFCDPDPIVRKEALEKLWDAWERIRSFRDPSDIQTSIRNILQEVAPEPNFRSRLNTEANELNSIGNNFMIRHARTSVTPISGHEQVD